MKFIDCSLSEAINYFNDYYNRVKGTKEINKYNEELDSFLILNNKVEDLKRLRKSPYFAVVRRRGKGGYYVMYLSDRFKVGMQAIYDEDAIALQRFLAYLESEETQKKMRQNDKKILILPLILSTFFAGVIIWSGIYSIFMLLMTVVFILVSTYSIKEFLTKE